MGNKICIIGVYFGKLPAYVTLWLKSCAHNPTIDFFLFTDQALCDLPQNVKCHAMTLERMKELADRALDLDTCLDRPYKCCDFKSVYGLVFRDYVSSYDYWGCCDFDLIFGDIQGMCDHYHLYEYDRFLGLGHLSLFRNTEQVNRRYMCNGGSVDYIKAFTEPNGAAFDEIPGLTSIYLRNGFPIFLNRIFVDIASIYHRYRIIEIYPYDDVPKNYKQQLFYWENGKTYRAYYEKGSVKTEEYMYIHFKKRPNFEVTFDPTKENAFYITNRGFFPKDTEATKEIMSELNPYPGWLYEKYEKIANDWREIWCKVKRRLKRG